MLAKQLVWVTVTQENLTSRSATHAAPKILSNYMIFRTLHSTQGSKTKAIVKIDFPVKIQEYQWQSSMELWIGDTRVISRTYIGLDGIQALQNAFSDMARLSSEFCAEYSMFENGKRGENGFPMAVPIFLGHDITCRLEKILSDATTAEIRNLEANSETN